MRLATAAALALVTLTPSIALAYGESEGGFPNWAERVILEWMNRARCDPQVEMTACGSACAEGACYKPIAPLTWDIRLNRAARFHSDEMAKQSYFAHNSACTVVQNIDAIYPATCDGSASCACVGGVKMCDPTCTSWSQRVGLFGLGAGGEIIASPKDPNQAFYLWLFESYNKTTCAYDQGPPTNGHRWNILKSNGRVGAGVGAGAAVGDFGGNAQTQKIPSGSHYPRQAATVEAWVNWYDAQPPMEALINVDGACQPLALTRGTEMNGAYKATVTGVGSGCHRYYFAFKDSAGNDVTYPDTGSLGIGPADGSCADWDSTRPAAGAGCSCTPSCNGKQCGDDGCGGTCGMCPMGATCTAGQCVSSSGGGGAAGNGGSAGHGGMTGNGGSAGHGGMTGNGGSAGKGGMTGNGGGAGNGQAGAGGDGGSAGEGGSGGGTGGGCGCRVDQSGGEAAAGAPLLLMALAALRRRRRRAA